MMELLDPKHEEKKQLFQPILLCILSCHVPTSPVNFHMASPIRWMNSKLGTLGYTSIRHKQQVTQPTKSTKLDSL